LSRPACASWLASAEGVRLSAGDFFPDLNL
jgi:hypothetical protein